MWDIVTAVMTADARAGGLAATRVVSWVAMSADYSEVLKVGSTVGAKADATVETSDFARAGSSAVEKVDARAETRVVSWVATSVD